ncbi:hypothetical protein CR513_57867, partial [Mucuna pruriens]
MTNGQRQCVMSSELPDGRNTLADKEGTINLGKGLVLHNVLYVLNLDCNLIFVFQLIHDSNCAITFSEKLCVIQDRTSRTVISFGEQWNGLNKRERFLFLVRIKLMNVWEPYRVDSSCDYFSCAIWIYLLVEKSELANTLKKFCTMVVTQFNKKVKIVRSDNDTKFRVLRSNFNDCVERKHGHILNISRTLCFEVNVPIQFWGEYILTVVYLINHTPSIIHKDYLYGKNELHLYNLDAK